MTDPDGQLALAVCYQLHYTSFEGVADTWEWDPGLLAVRAALEARFADALRHALVSSGSRQTNASMTRCGD